jgi:TATA-binding protein-associated factor
VLQIVLPLVPKSLHLLMAQLIPGIVAGARSVFAVIRNAAGKALAVTCQVMPQPGMQAVLQDLLPVLGDSRELKHRQGAIESIWSE